MDFWGAVVKPKVSRTLHASRDKVKHLSQVSFGEANVLNKPVVVYVKSSSDKEKFAIGTLIPNHIPHISCDLVFGSEFELTHSSKKRSIHFTGYEYIQPEDPAENGDSSLGDEDDSNVPRNKMEEELLKGLSDDDEDDESKDADSLLAERLLPKDDESKDADSLLAERLLPKRKERPAAHANEKANRRVKKAKCVTSQKSDDYRKRVGKTPAGRAAKSKECKKSIGSKTRSKTKQN